MTITETLASLDALFSKIDSYDWDNFTISIGEVGPEAGDDIREFIVMLCCQKWEIIRQAILDGMKYKEAGEVLERYLSEACELPERGLNMNLKAALLTYRRSIAGEEKDV